MIVNPAPMLQTSTNGSVAGVSRVEVGGEIDSSSELLPDTTLSDLGKGTHRKPRSATEGGNVNKNMFSTAAGASQSLQTPSLFKPPRTGLMRAVKIAHRCPTRSNLWLYFEK